MKFGKFIPAIAPLAAIALAGAVSGCDKVDFNVDGDHIKFNGHEGKKLSELDLSGTAITDKGLIHIGRLSKLKTLRLNVTYITDAGLASLAQIVDLETLDIRGTQVSAEGLRRLLGCTKLRRLDISGANRSNGLIDVLKGFHQLDELRLKGTAVSFRELVELCRALPKLSLRKVILASSFNDDSRLWDQNGEETITALQLSNWVHNGSVGDGCIQDDDLAFLREQQLLDELRGFSV